MWWVKREGGRVGGWEGGRVKGGGGVGGGGGGGGERVKVRVRVWVRYDSTQFGRRDST